MAVPNVSGVLRGWTKKQEVRLVTKSVVDAKVVQTATAIILDMNLQPLQAEKVNRKPEDQRAWKWFSILVKSNYQKLEIDNVLIVTGIPYRIESVQNWTDSGYIRYEAHEDYSGAIPDEPEAE